MCSVPRRLGWQKATWIGVGGLEGLAAPRCVNIWLAFQKAALRQELHLRYANFEVLAYCLQLTFHLQEYAKAISNSHYLDVSCDFS